MAMFRTRKSMGRSGSDPFTDLLFNALLTFTFLFLISLLLINPPAKSGIINPKAEFLITISWEDGNTNDIDTWVQGPQGAKVWYKQAQNGLMHLDRDDRGQTNDTQLVDGQEIVNPLNQEVVTIRGRPPGEFIVNVHYYKSDDKQQVPVTVYVAEVNPTLKVLHYSTLDMKKEGDEKTAVRFTLNTQGQVENINTLQTSIIGDG